MKFLIIFLVSLLNIIINAKDIFEDYYEKAEKILKNMTRNEKIGQMFLPRYTLETSDYEIKKYFPAGFVLFANNLVNHTEKQLIDELSQRQKISKIPLVFGVDEEGGTVCRVSLYFRKERFPSPRESYLKGGIEEILLIEQEKRDLLKKLNMNFNFAPVADISLNESDYIYARTLGENVSITTNYINTVIDSYNNDNFTCCLKHFPGYGNNINTHDDIAHDNRSIDYLKNNDLIPFINGVKHNVPMIMVSHNIILNLDEEYPSSISKIVHDFLRYEYGYTGLILTDSLSMGAITKYTKNISPAVLAVLAGNDIIVTSTFEKHITELITAVDNNEVDMDLIEKAAKRVIAWKLKYIYEQDNNEKDDQNNERNEEGNKNYILYIVLFSILGIVTIALIIFLIYKCNNKNKLEKSVEKNTDEKEEGIITNSKSEERSTENNLDE